MLGNSPKYLLPVLVLSLLSISCRASGESDSPASGEQQRIAQKFGLQKDEIRPAAVPGLYEIRMGAQIAYVSADGRYLVRGDVIDLNEQVNLSEQRRSAMRLDLLGEVPDSRYISFPAEDEKYVITVFTDIDCGYCRQLHAEMDRINAAGITVHYLFYPRAGVGSSSWHKAVEVWCSDDRKAALTRAKQGLPLAAKQCASNPVLEHYQLARKIGVSGTPAIVTDRGEFIRGYLPLPDLLRVLESGGNSR